VQRHVHTPARLHTSGHRLQRRSATYRPPRPADLIGTLGADGHHHPASTEQCFGTVPTGHGHKLAAVQIGTDRVSPESCQSRSVRSCDFVAAFWPSRNRSAPRDTFLTRGGWFIRFRRRLACCLVSPRFFGWTEWSGRHVGRARRADKCARDCVCPRQIPAIGALPQAWAGNDRVVTRAPATPQRLGKGQTR
jgi:hypothetical protein